MVPPKGAPNVLLIITDDQGYGVSGTFGGVIPTPSMDRLAKAGLRYTQFCSTALCSPTRAALITGRNHHSVGTGVIGEMSTGYPGYDSVIPKDKATAAGDGARFMGIVHHTDGEREFAYARQKFNTLDKALDEATAKGWTVVDMKNDWKVIFPFEKK